MAARMNEIYLSLPLEIRTLIQREIKKLMKSIPGTAKIWIQV